MYPIRTKLIVLFIALKIFPLVVVFYLSFVGVEELRNDLDNMDKGILAESKIVVRNAVGRSIEKSIKALDDKSQDALEKTSNNIATSIASFLYERDGDILFLSNLDLSQKTIQEFYKSKFKEIILHGQYTYNEKSGKYEVIEDIAPVNREVKNATLQDNAKRFSYNDPYKFKTKNIPIYKEIVYFDINGKEIYKTSSIDSSKKDVSIKKNTYIGSETYFEEIKNLKKGDIYVSDVIGEYVKSHIVGVFNRENTKKMGVLFEPEKNAYAGLENPLGKKFEGIIRFITPVYKNNIKVGYISLALDHRHIREFTATYNPIAKRHTKQNIASATNGNYVFIWDYEGKNIVHPRDHSIYGYSKKTGLPQMPWLSADIAEKFYKSGKEINEFLKNYPKFESQSYNKKANIKQVKEEGLVGLDCRYLNFAPQCQGWMQLTENGGYGSFVINWAGVEKLTVAATIPYFTGKYKNSPRGFGFVAMGANMEEFHRAVEDTMSDMDEIFQKKEKAFKSILSNANQGINGILNSLVNKLVLVALMIAVLAVIVAVLLSNFITSKINNLLKGTKKFANREFDYVIDEISNDEIGELEKSFNFMALEISALIKQQKQENTNLGSELHEKNQELLQANAKLEQTVEQRTKDLEKALVKAEESSRVKTNFLSNMSHEMKTPLNAIIGFSGIIKMTEANEANIQYAEIIENSSKELLAIINDVLESTKIESDELELVEKETNFHETIKQTLSYLMKKAEEKNISFSYSIDEQIPIMLIIDQMKIRQVLENIIGNAIKFTSNEGKVDVSILVQGQDSETIDLKFLIEDNGIGIPKEKIEAIFDPFTQADDGVDRKFYGAGLGLSISSHIVELMGSKIQLESELGKGSSFWFILKIKKTSNKEVSPGIKKEFIKEPSLTSSRILIIEKNPLNVELMCYYLRNLEIAFVFFDSLDEIKDFERGEHNDIIIINCDDLKENILSKNDSIVALVQEPLEKQEEERLQKKYNIVKFIQKPLKKDGLMGILEKTKSNQVEKSKEEDSKEKEQEKESSQIVIEEKPANKKENAKTEETTAGEEKMEETKTISQYKKEDAIKQLQLDEEIIDMLLGNFFEALDFDMQKLQDAIDSKDASNIVSAAHYLKGSCANLAMKEPAGILLEIETAAKNGGVDFDIAELKAKLDEIKKSLNV